MLGDLITFILAFVSTNIDDLFILMLFFAGRRFSSLQITVGQYVGVFTLVGISLAGSLLGLFLDPRYIGLMGLFPIYLGARQMWQLVNGQVEEEVPEAQAGNLSILSIALVTIANGGDNIGVYIPLLSTMSLSQKWTFIFVFIVMILCWCLFAKYLARHRFLASTLEKYGPIFTSIVLVLLGVFIIVESNAITLL